MANSVLSLTLVSIIVISLPALGTSISSCNDPCQTSDDCDGQLICNSGQCGDDPDVGLTDICSAGCKPLEDGGCWKRTYTCSPPVTDPTSAILTSNNFSEGGSGGFESKCDVSYHDNTELIVALSTGWFDNMSRCGKMIKITALHNGRTTTAKVVDECDSRNGCDEEHDNQPPCDNNIVDASIAVLDALGLNIDDFDGRAPITWSMA